jgi:hypothetical protein
MRCKICMGIALVILTARAHAQPGDATATADQLFNEGRELLDASRFAEACAKFEASLRLEDAVGTRLNLAACREQLGELGSAWSLYHGAIDLAAKGGDLNRREYARSHAAALEPQLAMLTIVLPSSRPPGFAVAQDRVAVDAVEPAIVVYLDAGPHEVSASAPGFEPFTKTVTLAVPARETVAIPTLKPASHEDHVPPEPPHADGHGAPSPTSEARQISPRLSSTDRVPQSGTEQSAIDGSPRERDAARADAHRLQVKGLVLAGIGTSMGLMYEITTVLPGSGGLSRADTVIFWSAVGTALAAGGICFAVGTVRDHYAKVDVTATPLHGGAAALVTGRW